MLDFSKLCVERPLGTKGNNEIIRLLCDEFGKLRQKKLKYIDNRSKIIYDLFKIWKGIFGYEITDKK